MRTALAYLVIFIVAGFILAAMPDQPNPHRSTARQLPIEFEWEDTNPDYLCNATLDGTIICEER